LVVEGSHICPSIYEEVILVIFGIVYRQNPTCGSSLMHFLDLLLVGEKGRGKM